MKLQIADDARLVIQVGVEQRDSISARRNVAVASLHLIVGLNPTDPMAEPDGIVRVYRASFERVVEEGDWADAMQRVVRRAWEWLRENEHVDVGAVEKLPPDRQAEYLPLLRGDFVVE